jgi:hypothetical protein
MPLSPPLVPSPQRCGTFAACGVVGPETQALESSVRPPAVNFRLCHIANVRYCR